jgi:hypothetical protein
MDTVLQALFSWQFVLFCLAIAAVTFVIRRVIEFVLDHPGIPASKSSKFWTDLFLPIFPVIGGPLGAWFASGYPYPEGLTSDSGRIIFGLVAGLLSGLVYRIAKSFLASKISGISDADAENIRQSINKD